MKRCFLSGLDTKAFVQERSSLSWGMQVSAERSDSYPRTASGGLKPVPDPVWLLINDFSISQTPRAEVLNLLHGHKLPCLMYYTQVAQLHPSAILEDHDST